jgi:sterol desaturase/sphingolipid hydroxylase (fatty acid hydroxylase superfamily)
VAGYAGVTTLELMSWICAGLMFGTFIVESVVSYFALRDGKYELGDTFLNVAITIGYVGMRVFVGAGISVILIAIYAWTPLRWSMDHWWHWVILFVFNDFLYYWSHRASHVIKFMWASHAVHHNSPVLNLSTGLRNSWVGMVFDWVFFVPTVALGFHPLAVAACTAVMSTLDFLTHTPYVGKLGFLDKLFNTPSNHRVHHAKNPDYVDKNMGGALIIWDRMFGTYAAEVDPAVFGVESMPKRRYNPVYLELYLWGALIRDRFIRTRGAAGSGAPAART